jgi:hypothetical protein
LTPVLHPGRLSGGFEGDVTDLVADQRQGPAEPFQLGVTIRLAVCGGPGDRRIGLLAGPLEDHAVTVFDVLTTRLPTTTPYTRPWTSSTSR